MKVDVHTHIWPDRIAELTLEAMTRTVGLEAIAPNTITGIKAHMAGYGVDKSIVLGIVDRADQVRRANDWLISIQDEQLVPFGAMHPDLEDKGAEVARLRESGIKGIKLHPVINGFYPDDPKMFPVYEEMGDSMVLEIHCGRLPHVGEQREEHQHVFAAPERIMNVVRQFPKLRVIALHLGGFYMLDEAERELILRERPIATAAITAEAPAATRVNISDREIASIITAPYSDSRLPARETLRYPLAFYAQAESTAGTVPPQNSVLRVKPDAVLRLAMICHCLEESSSNR